jgi:hypothetical protein|tara:strand:- start:1571 stop:2110 length:540 start_codon:yes stop_codon:yes gene_type:complete
MHLEFQLPDGEPADWDLDQEIDFIVDATALAEEYFQTGSAIILRSHRRALLNLGIPSYKLRDIMMTFVASDAYKELESDLWQDSRKSKPATTADKLPDPEDISNDLLLSLLYREATDPLGTPASRTSAISKLVGIKGMKPPKETKVTNETTITANGELLPVVNVYLNATQDSIAEQQGD